MLYFLRGAGYRLAHVYMLWRRFVRVVFG